MYNFRCKAKQSRDKANKEVMRIKYKNVAVLTMSILNQSLQVWPAIKMKGKRQRVINFSIFNRKEAFC